MPGSALCPDSSPDAANATSSIPDARNGQLGIFYLEARAATADIAFSEGSMCSPSCMRTSSGLWTSTVAASRQCICNAGRAKGRTGSGHWLGPCRGLVASSLSSATSLPKNRPSCGRHMTVSRACLLQSCSMAASVRVLSGIGSCA